MDTDVIIIGAGVVGLAIARQLSCKFSCIVIEKYPSFGWETSSRNSEVIHAGLYYPENSLKAKLCVLGNRYIYEFCEKYRIPYKKCGKLVISISSHQNDRLYKIYQNAINNGVDNLKFISNENLTQIEPYIIANNAFFSGNTGILDTHSFMQCLEALAAQKGTIFSYNSEVFSIEKFSSTYRVQIKTVDGQKFSIQAPIIINSAGLHSDEISQMVGINDENLLLNYCKGHYFRINTHSLSFKHLIYPVPDDSHSLGIHLTIDLNGVAKLGPDVHFLKNRDKNYDVPENLQENFFNAGNSYIRNLKIDYLVPDYSGIRPKLQKPNENFRDFYIQNEYHKGFSNFINLIGIESPGLTASLAIAEYVEQLII